MLPHSFDPIPTAVSFSENDNFYPTGVSVRNYICLGGDHAKLNGEEYMTYFI